MSDKVQRSWACTVTLSIMIALLLLVVEGRPESATLSYFYPRVEFGEGRKISLVLVNIGQTASNVRLLAHDAAGTLIKEIAITPAITAGERRDFSGENGGWPEGTATVRVECEGPLYSYIEVLG